jgi:hypothetical protein
MLMASLYVATGALENVGECRDDIRQQCQRHRGLQAELQVAVQRMGA